MKPILYAATETSFTSNGIGILNDVISAPVVQELNGQYELTMKYSAAGIHAEAIADRCIILAKPDPVADPQPFRIYRINPISRGTITVYAQHIAYDNIGIPVAPFTASSAADALASMKASAAVDCPFAFTTDKNTQANMDQRIPKSIWKTLGGSEGSILDTYGGEYEFDKFNIHLHERRGTDRGVSIRYGKNLTTLEQDRNCANCYTGVYPYWISMDNELVQLPEKVINAAGTYNYVKILPLDLSSEWQEAPTVEQLRERAEKYMEDNDIGIPDISWKIEFVQLEQTQEYKGKALLERVLLGDTVSVIFPKMNVNTSARAVKIEFDSILERYISVTLGKVKSNLADTIVKQQQENEQKPSKATVQSMITTKLDAINGVTGGVVRLLDTNGDGKLVELYIADNEDVNLAVKVWRFNYEGWAASKTGYNGPFEFGATLEDGILANAITACRLVAGTIQSLDRESFFVDLDNGIVDIKAVKDLSKDLDENKDETDKKIAELKVTADGLSSTVSSQSKEMDNIKKEMSDVQQSSDKVSVTVQSIIDNGVSKVTNEFGLTIDESAVTIHRDGSDMTNSLDETGMYVIRNKDQSNEQVMLEANANGVKATDVTVYNYLTIGHARFEDYKRGTDAERTGCFWV